jgi:hypothetical protein
MRASHLTLRGEVLYRSEADKLLRAQGDTVIVRRGNLRSLAIACPDGCGENLTINLDPATGPAWRLYERRRGLTLFPSIWRDTGCESHFIVWNSGILWCDGDDFGEFEYNETIEYLVLSALKVDMLQSVVEIAEALDEIPWDVTQVCRRLARKGLAIRGQGRRSELYKLKSNS